MREMETYNEVRQVVLNCYLEAKEQRLAEMEREEGNE